MKRPAERPLSGIVTAITIGALSLVCACAEDLDTTPPPSPDPGTFGDTVITLVCKRMAYLDDLEDSDGTVDVSGAAFRDACRGQGEVPSQASNEVKALLEQRDFLVDVVDEMWPQGLLDNVQMFATSDTFLSAYDDGTVIGGVDEIEKILRLVAPKQEANQVLENLGRREGYTPTAAGALASLVSAPQLDEIIRELSKDVAPGGHAYEPLLMAAEAAALELGDLELFAVPDDPERGAVLALDFLLGGRQALTTNVPFLMSVRDRRGSVVIAPGEDGSLPAPFADVDEDGLADINAIGQFVDADGAVIETPTPFALADEEPGSAQRDDQGRALNGTGDDATPLYQYIDLDRTVLAALARDAATLLDPDKGIAFDLGRTAVDLLGPRIDTSIDFDGRRLDYSGFNPQQSPVLDLAYAGMQILRQSDIRDTLALVQTIVADEPALSAQLVEAGLEAYYIGDELPEFGERAQLEEDSPLFDDLLPTLIPILQHTTMFPDPGNPGEFIERSLLEDLLQAVEDNPQLEELGDYLRQYVTMRDALGYNAETNEVVSLDSGQVVTELVQAVDRSAADTAFNRSIMQRILHILADTNGLSLQNKAGAQIVLENCRPDNPDDCQIIQSFTYNVVGELLDIPNLAVFYIRSMAFARDANGNFFTNLTALPVDERPTYSDFMPPPASITDYCDYSESGRFVPRAQLPLTLDPVDELFGRFTDTDLEEKINPIMKHCPTPQALNRLLFINPRPDLVDDLIPPITNAFGQDLASLHAGSLVSFEIGNFYDLVQPVIQVFVDHEAELLLVDVLTALHPHWPSRSSGDHQQDAPDAAGYAFASNLVSYEPLIAEVLARNNLLGGLIEHTPTLNAIVTNERSLAEILRSAGLFILSPMDGLEKRTGETTTTTPDGRPIDVLTPWHILSDAYVDAVDRLDAAPDGRGDIFRDALDEVIDIFARGIFDEESGWRFVNPRIRGLTLAVLDFLDGRIEAHDAADDREQWLTVDLPADVEEIATGPVVIAALDLLEALNQNQASRQALEGMLTHALSEGRDPATFRALITAVADILQLIVLDNAELVTLADVLGEILDPQRDNWLDPMLVMGRVIGEADDTGVIAETVRNLVSEYRPGTTVVGDLIDGIGEVYRDAPFVDFGQPYTSTDYETMFSGLAEFLAEEKRGLRKFIAIIQGRTVAAGQ